jgi:hypothetical protein
MVCLYVLFGIYINGFPKSIMAFVPAGIDIAEEPKFGPLGNLSILIAQVVLF